jgi:membrane protein required for beta-lactamase induction
MTQRLQYLAARLFWYVLLGSLGLAFGLSILALLLWMKAAGWA